MWDALAKIFTSANAVSILLFLIICILAAFVLVKSNLLQIHTDSIKLGARDAERNIIRQQQDYVWQHLTAAEKKLQKRVPDYDKRLGLIIVQACYIEYGNWIAQNHINTNDDYITLKQQKLVDVVMEHTEKEEFQSDEFIEYLKQDTKATILQLINIREIYNGQ